MGDSDGMIETLQAIERALLNLLRDDGWSEEDIQRGLEIVAMEKRSGTTLDSSSLN